MINTADSSDTFKTTEWTWTRNLVAHANSKENRFGRRPSAPTSSSESDILNSDSSEILIFRCFSTERWKASSRIAHRRTLYNERQNVENPTSITTFCGESGLLLRLHMSFSRRMKPLRLALRFLYSWSINTIVDQLDGRGQTKTRRRRRREHYQLQSERNRPSIFGASSVLLAAIIEDVRCRELHFVSFQAGFLFSTLRFIHFVIVQNILRVGLHRFWSDNLLFLINNLIAKFVGSPICRFVAANTSPDHHLCGVISFMVSCAYVTMKLFIWFLRCIQWFSVFPFASNVLAINEFRDLTSYLSSKANIS